MSSGFRALRSRNYRLWISGTLVSNVGTWMQRTAQDWLVLVVLTHHSGFAVGVTTALQFTPLMLFSAHAGVLADRLPKRKVLFATQSAMGLTSLIVGLLVLTHSARLWEVFVCAFVLGLASALDNPSRQAFVSEIVAREDVISAVSLNSASINAARLVGPGIAGVVIAAYGTGPAFLINSLSFGATLVSLARMRNRELHQVERLTRGPGQVREGISYVRGRPDILLVFCLTGIVCTFGLNFQMTNAIMATGAFHRGAREYGLLGTTLGIGSLGGALLGARRDRPRLRLLVAAAVCFGTCLTVAALSQSYVLYAVLLVPVGLSSITFLNSCNTAVQLSTPPHMRGRVLALYVAVRQGTTPIGAPIVGWLGGQFGARWSVLVGGIAALAAGATAFLVLARTPSITEVFGAALGQSVPRSDDVPAPAIDSG